MMRYLLLMCLACYAATAAAQTKPPSEHVFIITTDGFRWQEVFSGADSALINDDAAVMDKSLIRQLYWDSTAALRRKKLMPFMWNVIAQQGQLYGNRAFSNKVAMKNLYWISYPGYNELLTGYADPIPNPNLKLNNRNRNILEFLNRQPRYKGKVVAFSSWNVFPYILNEKRSGLPIYSGYRNMNDPEDATDQMIDGVQDQVAHHTHTRYDELTFSCAREYILKHHPSVVFIGFGETDECAHEGRYDLYLQHAAAVDRMIAELWYLVQTDPEYKDHTTFIITTDHGRGNTPESWHTHGLFTKGSNQTWLACIGAGIEPLGEMHQEQQIYGKQLSATVSQLLGEEFTSNRPIGKAIAFPSMTVSAITALR